MQIAHRPSRVGPFSWEMFLEYRKALREVMSRQKRDLDYTGNGLNHPNDFGHRLYALAILDLLAK